eukprot:COSAG02_NODE_2150_length_9660_cov_45.377889_10_plen_66_part_00
MAAIVNRPFKTVEVTTGVEELVLMTTLLVCAIVGRKEYHRPAAKQVSLRAAVPLPYMSQGNASSL